MTLRTYVIPKTAKKATAKTADALDIAARYLVYKLYVPRRALTEAWHPLSTIRLRTRGHCDAPSVSPVPSYAAVSLSSGASTSDRTTLLNPASRSSTAFSWARVKPRHSYSTCAALAGSVAWMV